MSEFPVLDQSYYMAYEVPVVGTEGVSVRTANLPMSLRAGEVNLANLERMLQLAQGEMDLRRRRSDGLLQPLFDKTAARLGEFADMGLVRTFFSERTDLKPNFSRILMIDSDEDLISIAFDSRMGEDMINMVNGQSLGRYLPLLDATVINNPINFDTSTDRTYYEATLVYLLAESTIEQRFKNHVLFGEEVTNAIFPDRSGMQNCRLIDILSTGSQAPLGVFYNDGWVEHIAGEYRDYKRSVAPADCNQQELELIAKAKKLKPSSAPDLKYAEVTEDTRGRKTFGMISDQAYAAMALDRLNTMLAGALYPALDKAMVEQSAAHQRDVAKLVRAVHPELHKLLIKVCEPEQFPATLAVVESLKS